MLINSTDEYKNDLFLLWKEAFGDEDGYISLFFDTVYNENAIVFAQLDDGKIISALYLLPSYITDNGTSYEGFYLYAAATLKSYRGKGYMGKLINEAKTYALDLKKSFISLVPGEEYLYSYYDRYGFKPVMYRCKDTIKAECGCILSEKISLTFEEYFKARDKKMKVPFHHFCPEAYKYASECYDYTGLKAYHFENSLLIYDNENYCIREFLSDRGNDCIKSVFSEGDFTVFSPYGKKREPYGMVWFADENTNIKDIYMNIALD